MFIMKAKTAACNTYSTHIHKLCTLLKHTGIHISLLPSLLSPSSLLSSSLPSPSASTHTHALSKTSANDFQQVGLLSRFK